MPFVGANMSSSAERAGWASPLGTQACKSRSRPGAAFFWEISVSVRNASKIFDVKMTLIMHGLENKTHNRRWWVSRRLGPNCSCRYW